MYIPALILFDTNSLGFSTKLLIFPLPSSYTTTPYLDGSSTFVTFNEKINYILLKSSAWIFLFYTYLKHLNIKQWVQFG